MFKLFASLYLFVVISMVGLTALLENVLLPQHKELQEPTLTALAIALSQSSPEKIPTIAQISGAEVTQHKSSHLALPAPIQHQFEENGYLILYDSGSGPEIFINGGQEQLFKIVYPNEPDTPVWLFSSLFFIMLGLALAFWTWPLWRDIQALESNVKAVNADGTLPKLTLRPSSNLNTIANALGQLSDKVKSLLQSQRELSGAVAHEFRTPLSRLKFALAMVDDKSGVDSQGMQSDVNELENLVQEMLDYATLESDAPPLSMAEISLFELCKKLIHKLQSSMLQPPNFTLNASDSTITADGYFIERAIQNVLVNAMKYANSRVEVSIEQKQNEILVIVDDDGVGIAPENHQKVFEPFYRPDGARSRDKGGAGLGLAIVSRIQKWHNGYCWVESCPLGGARFVLSYPKSSLTSLT